MRLVEVRNVLQLGVVPEVLKVVVVAGVGHEDVHHHRAVVHGHPQGVLASGDGRRALAAFLEGKLLDRVGHGLYLLRRTAGADDEMARRRRDDVREVGDGDFAALLFLYAFDDAFYERCLVLHL